MVILVDNVNNLYNLIIGGLPRILSWKTFGKFFHGSNKFLHIARTTFQN